MNDPRPDLLYQDEIRAAVRDAYRDIATGAGRAVTERFYTAGELAGLGDETIGWALGVGNPVRHAELSEGEVVLDLGCGAGIDTVLAARRVGPSGQVIALDLLTEMRERTRAAVRHAGVDRWCRVETAEMEAIPLPDESVDAVISNGVLNLSPRKSRALAEIARVLRPGGRLCIADLIIERDLPPEVLGSKAAWAGCIAGAVSERVLTGKLERAGLIDVDIAHPTDFSVDDVADYPLFTSELVALMRRVLAPDEQARIAEGVVVRAAKAIDAAAPPQPVLGTPTGVVRIDDIAPDTVEAPGVDVRHLERVDDVHLKVLDVEPGGSTPFHTHPHAHEGVVIGGTGELRLDGRSERLGLGDVFTVNPNELHAIVSDPELPPLRFVCMDCFVE